MKINIKLLKNIATIIAGQSPPSTTYNSVGSGLPFFQGKTDFGDKFPTAKIWCTGKKVKKAIQNDILMSVRAPVGPVNICNEHSIIGRGLAAIRPQKGNSYEYLYYFLKNSENKIASLGTGSTFKAITKDRISAIKVPMPHNYDDQIRIATILSKAENLIAKRKESIELLDELLKSTFLDMFGDPVRNEKGWEKKPLNKLGLINRGVSKNRPRNAPKLLGGKYPLIQTGDITKAGIYITKYYQTYSEIGFKQSKLWRPGTLCITIAANIARTGILTFDACFPDSIVGFIANSDRSNTIYVHFLFGFFQKILEKNAPQAAQKNINLGILRNLKIPCPPLPLQNKFAKIVEKVESIRLKYQQSLTELENLYGTLSQRAFKGELDLSKIPIKEEPKPIAGTADITLPSMKMEGEITV